MTAALVAPSRPAHGQRSVKRPVVAWLSHVGTLDVPAFLSGLRAHGYVPGQTVSFDRYETPSDNANVSGVVARLLTTDPQVILASSADALDTITRATRTIPIVGVDLEADPIARGWISRLASPGGNVTGVFVDIPELSGQHLKLLREVKPDLARVAVLGVAGVNDAQVRALEAAATSSGLTVHRLTVKTLEQVPPALADARKQGATTLVALTSPTLAKGLRTIADTARTQRLVSLSPSSPEFAEAGGLLAFGPSLPDAYRPA